MAGKTIPLAVLLAVLLAASLYALHAPWAGGQVRVRVATTTSLYATGLLDYLAEEYRGVEPGVVVDYVAVGSGAALEIAARGDACAVFVHAPSLEKKYLEKGLIEEHRIIAYNYFVVVGPRDDPAGVRGAGSAVEAFEKIYAAGEEGRAVFVSRGDNSGTHVKELSLWRAAGLDPRGRPWYFETGSGMGETLVKANELRAYTLSDIGTYLKYKSLGRIPVLEILYTNSTELINIYSTYLSAKCTGPERRAAEGFLEFVYENQEKLIGGYGVEEYGQPLFYPAKPVEDKLWETWERLARG